MNLLNKTFVDNILGGNFMNVCWKRNILYTNMGTTLLSKPYIIYNTPNSYSNIVTLFWQRNKADKNSNNYTKLEEKIIREKEFQEKGGDNNVKAKDKVEEWLKNNVLSNTIENTEVENDLWGVIPSNR